MKKIISCVLSVVLFSCNETNQIVESQQLLVTLTVQNLPPLDEGHYQLWATFLQFNKTNNQNSPLHDEGFVSLGEFIVASDGTVRNVHGEKAHFALPAGSNAQLLQDIVIAVQTDHESALLKAHHEEPGSILIGGKFYGDANQAFADLTLSYADAFITDFASVTGKCTITAPTSPADSNSGLWFIESKSPVSAGLKNTPALPGEWRYEGWVRRRNTDSAGYSYQSTGKFMKADSADFDGAGPYSDTTQSGYNYPGQDFVQGAGVIANLLSSGFSFMVTVEPFPDNSPEPFFLTLLATPEVLVPSAVRTLTMQNTIASVAPSARVLIDR